MSLPKFQTLISTFCLLFCNLLILSYMAESSPVLVKLDNTKGQSNPIGTYYDKKCGIYRIFQGGGRAIDVNYNKRCPDNFIGLKAHKEQPQYYYECKKDLVVFGRCPYLHVFDKAAKKCVYQRYVDLDVDVVPAKCTKEGTFPVKDDCSLYYICNKNGRQFESQVFRCPVNSIYSSDKRQCSPINDSNENIVIYDDSIKCPKDYELEFPGCSQEGVFTTPKNCSLYFKCSPSGDFGYTETRYSCDKEQSFSIKDNKCLPKDKVSCEEKHDDEDEECEEKDGDEEENSEEGNCTNKGKDEQPNKNEDNEYDENGSDCSTDLTGNDGSEESMETTPEPTTAKVLTTTKKTSTTRKPTTTRKTTTTTKAPTTKKSTTTKKTTTTRKTTTTKRPSTTTKASTTRKTTTTKHPSTTRKTTTTKRPTTTHVETTTVAGEDDDCTTVPTGPRIQVISNCNEFEGSLNPSDENYAIVPGQDAVGTVVVNMPQKPVDIIFRFKPKCQNETISVEFFRGLSSYNGTCNTDSE